MGGVGGPVLLLAADAAAAAAADNEVDWSVEDMSRTI